MTRRARPAVGSDALAAVAGGVALAGSIAMLPPTAPARALRDYGGYQQPLPKNVGDSIARGDSTRVFAAASNLPAAFSVVEYGPSNQDFPIAARCAMRLRDDRDGTRLTLSISTAATGSVVQRADTAWTHVRSFGYYMVEPKGRYGVGDDQTLRVGCGSYTRVAVNGREIDRQNVVTLDTPNDDRARGVAAQFLADLHLRADIVELGEGRINIGIADSLASRPEGGDLAFGRAAFAILRARLGAATPETLAVLSQLRKDSWSTVYFYNSMAR